MNILTKNLLAGAIVGSLALTGAVIAEEGVKHRTIEINAIKDSDVNVTVDSDAGTQTLIFSAEELKDKSALEAKLAHLDDDTKKIVMQALQGVNMSGEGDRHMAMEKVYVMNKGGGERVEFIGKDGHNIDIEMISDGGRTVMRKHIIHGDGEGERRVLKGHSDAITKLIEKGEFSRDELDKIQAALDAKR